MEQKKNNLYRAIKKFTEETRSYGPLSIVPYGLIGYKNIVIQERPFLELKKGSSFLFNGRPSRGAEFIIFYPQHQLEIIKPLLGIMLMLLEKEVPLIIMPYKGVDWMIIPLMNIDIRNFWTEDPVIFLNKLREEREYFSVKMPENALSNYHNYAINHITSNKWVPIPTDMKISDKHEKYSLQGV